ncbi:diguanylate cyclase [Colwellia sp. Bg11-12]|uniref:sensor domain-containing diguanylate cyclase n=1 Tax=Colwellia sp. Bg11-12 TaxID=2759817 RepID=UPI0015F69C89|nr:diguanylate cyclase [Colwellia sp. Bg11-12]MBA6262261.1 diguanylate cyclase [Colwellia sp. Bg11-12]
MKSLTFNQLQLRVLVLLFLLFTSALVGYRYFIELPKLEVSTSLLANRELDALTFSIENMLKNISKTSFDYAVWTSTYDFMVDQNQDYIDENIIDNTFKSLEINGIFYINKDLELILGKGLNYKTGKSLNFSFYDFKKHPHYLTMLPTPKNDFSSPNTKGFMTTQHGPAIYSVNQVRKSDLGGEHRGFLILIKLIENDFTEDLGRYTVTKISFSPIPQDKNLKRFHLWNEKSTMSTVEPFTQVLIEDMNTRPVAILKMVHSLGNMPNLVNEQSLIFITLLSFVFYMVHRLISITIIMPVKKLANDIKIKDTKEKYTKLNENYTVKELSTVSRNVNKLMFTIKKQNELLTKQVNTDQLTQVMNRYGLKTGLDKHKDQCIRHNVSFIVVICDIDHFKSYNDSFGHMKGDETLYEVAQSLEKHCKRSTDICARFGGEEFVLLFSEMSEDNLQRKMQDIIDTIGSLNIPHSKSPTAPFLTVSLGATIVQPSDVVDFSLPLDEIVKTADKALYQAKANGRNRFVINYFSSNN